MARPLKDIHRISQMISCYEKDLLFFEAHRGKLTLSAYLIEAGYHYAGDVSRDEKRIIELQEAKKKIAELQNELDFEKLKNKKRAPPENAINEGELLKFYQEKQLAEAIKNMGGKVNWDNIFDKNIERLSNIIPNSKELQKWCMCYFRSNGQPEDSARSKQARVSA